MKKTTAKKEPLTEQEKQIRNWKRIANLHKKVHKQWVERYQQLQQSRNAELEKLKHEKNEETKYLKTLATEWNNKIKESEIEHTKDQLEKEKNYRSELERIKEKWRQDILDRTNRYEEALRLTRVDIADQAIGDIQFVADQWKTQIQALRAASTTAFADGMEFCWKQICGTITTFENSIAAENGQPVQVNTGEGTANG